MPKTPSSGWSARPTLDKVAAAGQLVVCKCLGCRKSRTYLASDLLEYFGPTHVVGELFGRCPHCDFAGNWRERCRYPNNDDVLNRTVIRKLKGWRRTAIWADEPYEVPTKPKPKLPGMWGG